MLWYNAWENFASLMVARLNEVDFVGVIANLVISDTSHAIYYHLGQYASLNIYIYLTFGHGT